MAEQAGFQLRNRNPDVLTCIANLSNDEVFTPPEFANRMLDLVAEAWATDHDGASIWADSTVRFLDPFTKSGVFLREINKRLVEGLAEEIPDLQERVDHILTKQVFGIGITQLTSLIARRSLYCSKWANGEHSIASSFDSADGNIWFEPVEHTWAGATEFIETADAEGRPVKRGTNGRCTYCGTSQRILEREDGLETYAYAFIHTNDVHARMAELFGDDMQFDVIIGNPPYQLQSDGGTRDVPIYHHFVEQAKKLQPRLLCMVMPSRWMAGGLGLGEFRQTMLTDKRIRELVEYPVSREVFPGVEVKGGICYFLWDATYHGRSAMSTVRDGNEVSRSSRDLDEFDILVRDGRGIEILRKVLDRKEESITTILSVDKEFGWTSNFSGYHSIKQRDDVPLYYNSKGKRLVGYVARSQIKKSAHLVDTWKVLTPKAGSDGGQRIPDVVLGQPMVVSSPSVCTQTYLFFFLDNQRQAESVASYFQTKFFRFLVSLRKMTQDATRSTYLWVPVQAWDRAWSDQELYSKYELSAAEISYIESMIKDLGGAHGG
ncbi:Eco57I restriction-modification methylase domain-containing protein [Nostocoides jenkinsii]|uniref:Eco57I restriction-modification methylase domain-containing protein n=1 Tax=Nostocoides jenkinsii TaxID=330834 RepID=UPI00065BEDA9|nr:Eco57I restriction-modification methylase domain-containing protein [Tetrasphaera jenkinsii]